MRLFARKPKPTKHDKATQPITPLASEQGKEITKNLQVLSHLNRFGWLTVAQITFLLYGDCPDNPRAQPYKNTRKILACLYRKRELFIRILPNNSRAYLLSNEGAKQLQNATGDKVISGDNILTTHPTMNKKTGHPNEAKSRSPSWIHRWVANEYVIRNGLNNALTEVEIFRKNAPFPKQYDPSTGINKRARSWKGKAPDALLIREENGVKYLTWIEVENAKRRSGGFLDSDESNQRGGLQSLAIWLASAFKEDIIEGQVRIEKVVFIIVTSSDTKHRLMRFMGPIYDSLDTVLEHWYPTDLEEQQAAIYSKIFIEEYVLTRGPRLMEVRNQLFDGRRTTMVDIASMISLELMQEDKPPMPRTDGIMRV